MTAVPSGNGSPSGTVTNASSTKSPPLMIGIEPFLERRDARAPDRVEQPLAVLAQLDIGADDVLDRVDDLVRAEGVAQDLADRGVFRARAAQQDLVELDAFLVDAEDADMAGVVMAAGIDAAGDLDLELTQIVLALEVGETLLDRHGDRDRPRIGEIAIIEAWAADDVGDEAGICGREIERLQP